MNASPETAQTSSDGLSLEPFRGLRPAADGAALARLLCPPYDVIDASARAELLEGAPDNAVAVILPEPTPEGYAAAAERLDGWVADGVYRVDDAPCLYVYELRDPSGAATRGLLGAIELRDPDDGVILPHENTMAGPVADRLAVMTATDADLEPIYLVYDGGGDASEVVRQVDDQAPLAQTMTPDGVTHRLWSITDQAAVAAVRQDLATRRALIADGHHRYATYRERQRVRRETDGAGPWDRGMALVVDSTDYGPQVHPIHRVIAGLTLDDAVQPLNDRVTVEEADGSPQQLTELLSATAPGTGFAAVLTDGTRSALVTDPRGTLHGDAARPGEPAALADLDVTVLHRGLVESVWGLTDDVETVRYAHSAEDAVRDAVAIGGVAVLLRPTPVTAVAAVAAAGARMPRKSTLFTPKPASGLVMRRLADQL